MAAKKRKAGFLRRLLDDALETSVIYLVAALLLVLLLFLTIGFGVLSLFLYLQETTSAPIAALICAGAFLVLAGIIVAILKLGVPRKKTTQLDGAEMLAQLQRLIEANPREATVLAAITGFLWQTSGKDKQLIADLAKAYLTQPQPETTDPHTKASREES